MVLALTIWVWITSLGGVFVVLGGVLGWAVFPWAVDIVIGKELALNEGSDAFDRFVDLPLDLDFKLSIFNVTNTEEIMKGAKPKLQEMGPYVYKQHRKKYNLKYNEADDTWTYQQQLLHFFDQEQSGEFKETDKVTVIHPALMSILSIMQNIPVLAGGTTFLDAAKELLFPEGVFITTTADELLIRGVRIPCGKIEQASSSSLLAKAAAVGASPKAGLQLPARLAALITCSSFKRVKVQTLTVLPDGDVLFSLFGYKNTTFDGTYTVNAGIRNPKELGQITAWEGKHFVPSWGGPTCNAVNGTQGDIFSPYITRDTTISVFSTDICRSMDIKYWRDTEYRGIKGYLFAPGREVMASVEENGDNYCFCPQVAKGLTKENGCLRRGAVDLSGCQGIPVIISYPHFYEADPFYLDAVEGLNPDPELHRLSVAIEPMTGTPLIGGKKMQLNFELKRVEGVKMTYGVRTTLFPVAWMYEGAQLNDQLLELVDNLLISKLKILDGVKYAMVALGVVMFISGSGMIIYLKRAGHRVNPAKAPRQSPDETDETRPTPTTPTPSGPTPHPTASTYPALHVDEAREVRLLQTSQYALPTTSSETSMNYSSGV